MTTFLVVKILSVNNYYSESKLIFSATKIVFVVRMSFNFEYLIYLYKYVTSLTKIEQLFIKML